MMYCPIFGLGLEEAGGCELVPLWRPPGAGGAGRVAILAEGGAVDGLLKRTDDYMRDDCDWRGESMLER